MIRHYTHHYGAYGAHLPAWLLLVVGALVVLHLLGGARAHRRHYRRRP